MAPTRAIRAIELNQNQVGKLFMWPSETAASRVYNAANIGLIIGLLLGLVSTALLMWMGYVKEAYLGERLSTASNRADGSEKELRNLRQQMNYRTLSPEQLKLISSELRSLPQRKVQIICPAENQEACGYANQLSESLRAAHWDTGAGIVRQPRLAAGFGITIVARENLRDGAQSLMGVLNLASVSSNMNITPAALAGYIQIIVGPKT